MPYFKKRFYEQSILKAQHDYECFLTNLPIPKGEYYLLIKVQSEAKRVGDSVNYYPTFPIRLSTSCLGIWTLEEIIEKVVSPVEDNSDKIKELEEKIKKLEETNKGLLEENNCLLDYYCKERFKYLKECERNYIIKVFKNGGVF